MIGIALSVFGFVVIASVMNGFSSKMEKALMGFGGHVMISPKSAQDLDALRLFLKEKGESFHESLEMDGVLFSGDESTQGVRIREVSKDFLRQPSLTIDWYEPYSLEKWESFSQGAILVGEGLMEKLVLQYAEAPSVTLMNPFGELAPTGEIVPRQQTVKIMGTFETGYHDYDQSTVLMPQPWGSRLAGVLAPDILQMRVHLKNWKDAPAYAQSVRHQFPDLRVTTWQDQNMRLLGALKMERFGMGILLSLVVLIATFNVLGLMSLYHSSKESEKNILLALGLPAKEVRHIFTSLGFLVSLLGALPGLLTGLAVVYYLSRYPLPLPEAYYMGALPVKLPVTFLVAFVALIFVVTTGSAWWVAKTRSEPGLVLRGIY